MTNAESLEQVRDALNIVYATHDHHAEMATHHGDIIAQRWHKACAVQADRLIGKLVAAVREFEDLQKLKSRDGYKEFREAFIKAA